MIDRLSIYSKQKEPAMPVNPLANRPVPPNSNLARGMFVWVGSTPASDPLDTDSDQQALINFCGSTNVGCNLIYLDIWRYLGGANWTAAKVTRMKQFLDVAHRSGIRVYALCGDLGWAVNQAWVMKNIVEPIIAYNALSTKTSEQFDGLCLDVEYWADEAQYPPATNLPGLCDLMNAIRTRADRKISVGCFAAFYLKDNSGTRPPVAYNGKWAQDGEHMMDAADFVIVGSYRNHAADNGTDGPGQVTLFQPWYDYAGAQARNIGIFAGSETTNVAPAYITYYGMTKAQMEAQHTVISAAFQVPANAAFIGQAVHSYDGWKAMP